MNQEKMKWNKRKEGKPSELTSFVDRHHRWIVKKKGGCRSFPHFGDSRRKKNEKNKNKTFSPELPHCLSRITWRENLIPCQKIEMETQWMCVDLAMTDTRKRIIDLQITLILHWIWPRIMRKWWPPLDIRMSMGAPPCQSILWRSIEWSSIQLKLIPTPEMMKKWFSSRAKEQWLEEH